jgi:hypothetical protein|tara:strand:+ start:337 stop:447 length:111 start_codon:yes stop_codon:yes gene_type:complete
MNLIEKYKSDQRLAAKEAAKVPDAAGMAQKRIDDFD